MNSANQLTLLRLLLAPLFVILLLYASPDRPFLRGAALAVFVAACLTDGLDGYLARRWNQKTTLGSYVDPLADKLLLTSGFVSLSFMGHLPPSMHIPAWVTIPVISRDVLILTGSLLIFILTGTLKAEPLFVGKLTTVSQMATLFLALLAAPLPLKIFFFAATVILTILSGVRYLQMGAQLAQASQK